MTRPVVFLGPSLPLDDARAILDADYRPPASAGDVMRALDPKPPAIAIIDGIFKDAPTVRHREILWAMSEGVPAFGASSMGALRAAELSGAGMIGVGLVYRWFRRFPLLPDDAVAVTHAPAALGHQPLSAALVDIRRSVAAARRAGAIRAEEAARLVREAEAQPFPERSLPEVCEAFRVDQKARDARALLHVLYDFQRAEAWPRPAREATAITHAWLDDLADGNVPVRMSR